MKLFREAIVIFGIYLMGELISGLLNLPYTWKYSRDANFIITFMHKSNKTRTD